MSSMVKDFCASLILGMCVFVLYVSLSDAFYLWIADPVPQSISVLQPQRGPWSGLKIVSDGFFIFHDSFFNHVQYSEPKNELLLLFVLIFIDGLTIAAWGWIALVIIKSIEKYPKLLKRSFQGIILRAVSAILAAVITGALCLFLSLWIPQQQGSVFHREMQNSQLKLNRTGELLRRMNIIPSRRQGQQTESLHPNTIRQSKESVLAEKS